MATTLSPEEERPQAGPLPSKRGEIGFREDLQCQAESSQASSASTISVTIPARHPADTPLPPLPTSSPLTASPTTSTALNPSDAPTSSDAERSPRPTSPSTASLNSTNKLTSFFNGKHIPIIWGLRITTLSVFFLQAAILGGTIAGWVVLINHLQATASATQGMNQSQNNGLTMDSALIFVYVAFGITTLVQIVFLERCIFRLRAERWAYIHPGEVLPTRRGGRGFGNSPRHPTIAFVPWNRPPLPTYAAALAQSGVGTGDVEDHMIAVPPPPAYGDRHASTLLLAGAIPDRLRRVRDSANSAASLSWVEVRRTSQGNMEQSDSRPVSYMSHDPDWEERLNADAAARLEEQLTQMEEGSVVDTPGPHSDAR
ncbi:uncharacterized protein FIBRA_00861 [Fibroporia radiculosa]|uniref:Uncharacterized protein n=1 Tax=Fibroporia radiculosa TaxID=599839 RepID=J4GIS5_9APHY|nr:uncharacterized protein FIBRA_00861 [Fibroporia radiculosa]CCL98855.1 predicted protein [Fibroporia radiculosa]